MRLVTIFSLVLVCSGCSIFSSKKVDPQLAAVLQQQALVVPQASVVAALPPARPSDEIAPGYLIKLSSDEDKALNGKFRVDFEGKLSLPYNVELQAADISAAELRNRVLRAYSRFFVGMPSVSVSIDSKDCYVDVGGLVVKPGRFLVKSKSTLDELVADAGGLLPSPSGAGEYAAKYANITQKDASRLVRLSEYYAGGRDLIPAWRGGDKVFFQSEGANAVSAHQAEKNYIQVLGQVGIPGEYTYEDGVDFFYYLAKSGGPKESANLDKIEIIRTVDGARQSIKFDLSDVSKVPQIRGGDIILVHANKQNTLIPNVTSAVSAVATSVIAGTSL